MPVAEIWRYPIKSLTGERLEAAWLTPNGIAEVVIAVASLRGR